MKRIILIFLLLLTGCNVKAKESSFVSATSYIVLEQSANKIIEGNNYNEQRSVASISKIMTAIVIIENVSLDKIVVVPEEINKVYGSFVYLKVNEEVSIEKLLYALLLRSGNDAAVTLALSICKTIDEFVVLMNKKAEYLNLKDTYFNNPHGLDEEDGGNISTAYDMAILYSYCMDNETFAKIVSTKTYKTYNNKNRLLRNYDYCTGGKTGFTKKAKRTLITSASKDNINLVIVTLNCGDDFVTHQKLYENYFDTYQSIKVLSKGYNSFDNKNIYINKDYYFITDLKNANLIYFINYNTLTIHVTLYDEKKHVCDYLEVRF